MFKAYPWFMSVKNDTCKWGWSFSHAVTVNWLFWLPLCLHRWSCSIVLHFVSLEQFSQTEGQSENRLGLFLNLSLSWTGCLKSFPSFTLEKINQSITYICTYLHTILLGAARVLHLQHPWISTIPNKQMCLFISYKNLHCAFNCQNQIVQLFQFCFLGSGV